MSAGTITLTNNSDAVAGAGTAFITDLVTGDCIVANVGGIAYTLPVKTVASDTALTIISKFTGPTMNGLAWFVVTSEQQSSITAALVAQSTEALRGLNFDKQNWQNIFSDADQTTVTLPDGTQFSGPSWQKIVTLLAQSDIEAIQPLADQVRADAQQVAADLSAAETAATISAGAAIDASDAAAVATHAKTDAVAANNEAQGAADTATSQAEASEASAKRAEAAAESLDTTNFVRKDQPEEGRDALEVYSRYEVDEAVKNGGSGIPLGFQYHHSNRAKLNAGTVVGDGQVVTIAGSFSDLADHAEAKEPLTTEALWQSDPGKRGCYVIDRTAGTMRLPDLNGVQPGSYGPVYKTGDGGTVAPGTISQNATPNATGFVGGIYGEDTYIGQWVEGAFYLDPATNPRTKSGLGTAWNQRGIRFDLSRSNAAFGRNGATRVKPDSQHGVWVIQYANAAQNSAEIDALGIDTDLQNSKAALTARIASQEGRIGYALLSPGTLNLNTATILDNPFGNNTPVICTAEFYHPYTLKWVEANWQWYTSTNTRGLRAMFSEGIGIVIRVAVNGFVDTNANCGFDITTGTVSAIAVACPVRVHVWKVTQ